MSSFGSYLRARREALYQRDPRFSLRQVAQRAGIKPTYLSKLEREELDPPSEKTTLALAKEVGEDPDVMLALAGKVSSDLQAIIRKHPKAFAELIRQFKDMPEHAILRVVREVRDGEW
jgi:transcriptional regulator with XRE-family HTH domain